MKNIKTIKIYLVVLFVLFLNLIIVESCNALSVSVRIPEKYMEIEAGERLYFEVEVKYPENSRRKDLRFNYEIKKGNEIISQSKSLRAIETQISFIDYMVMPEDIKKGMYSINLVVNDYEELEGGASSSFHVIGGRWAQLQWYFLTLLGVIILVGGILYKEIAYFAKNKK